MTARNGSHGALLDALLDVEEPLTDLRARLAALHLIASAAEDAVADIERLGGLRASGTLSEAEFETLKIQVVAGSARA